MSDAEPCGRILFVEEHPPLNYYPGFKRPTEDVKPVCLMHSISDRKRSEEMRHVFQDEIDAILAGEKSKIGANHNPLCADFTAFEFLKYFSLRRSTYAIPLVFSNCVFESEAEIRDCMFEKDVTFDQTVFQTTVRFLRSEFRNLSFSSCRFKAEALFSGIKFTVGYNSKTRISKIFNSVDANSTSMRYSTL